MANRDVIEIYHGDDRLVTVDSSMVPPVGSFISIRGHTWEVKRVTFAVDHADKYSECRMRCNIDVQRAT